MRRPRWSVMIPTYNCARYLRATLASVLQQAPGPEDMQIEVVDDASSDNPEAVVRAVGQGRIGFYRQPRNVGHIGNFATCLNRAAGQLVHLLHGDDQVEPGFYAALQAGFDADPAIGAAFCRHRFIDAQGAELSTSPLERAAPGRLIQGLQRLAQEQCIMTPSVAVRRATYEALGGFDDRLTCSEDWEMWVRIAAARPVWYEPQVLASYRMHGQSNTARHYRLAEELTYTRKAIDLFSRYLPEAQRRSITRIARRTYARTALSNARRMAADGDRGAMYAHLWAALRFAPGATALKAAQIALHPRELD
ncbi:glycosyltransferase family 2 protein [Phenylobacterium sp.]|uniref:glycosyltransferase family 2 protein n=1 Tax=Phenylobacterium sp. TaxID=1871053 RepID=UPI00378378C5